ncbi:carboxypeptidase family protein [Alteromonas pelagimontana]|uniref:Carboxypeptidase family protein n=1 Tax=Alteromonas pelagimontana TaxID=1858656 RepID=A0A6M4MK21_9ALTE|nr:M14-type cytosolic carboxypeptidase [Alteromonas pelagimontana]QJR82446.1 carboxypeptidase family protein [Alteromonas pelagimontana]
MHISSQFDSGNIEVIRAESPDDIVLSIPKDNQSEFYQWFHFRLFSEAFTTHRIAITNLAKSAYPNGWKDYDILASYNRQDWFRIKCQFDGDNLSFDFTPEQPAVYFAYFIPYSYERHLDLIHDAQMSLLCEHRLLGLTVDGRDMSMLVIGEEDPGKKKIWVTARQHPGETMAQWCAEGLIYRLLDEQDGLSRHVLENAVFYIVPNMNPDGGARGHLRCNAVGTNLNREWAAPSKEKSPEVWCVLEAMNAVGVDMYLDLHGDEALPYNFVAGSEGIPAYSERLKELENKFKDALLTATPEFQDVHGYAKDEPGKANLTVASNAVGNKFDCLAYTLEMPFKDNKDLPDPVYGWSVQRCKQLGEDLLIAVRAVASQLR